MSTEKRIRSAACFCREALRAIAPPIAMAGLRRLRGARLAAAPVEWEYLPRGWQTPGIPAYDDKDVLAVQQRQWEAFSLLSQRKDWLSHPSVSLMEYNFFVTFAYVLARTARSQTAVSLLDYGGGLGRYCLAARALLPEVEIDYHCRELPALAARGAQLLPNAHFYADDSCFGRT